MAKHKKHILLLRGRGTKAKEFRFKIIAGNGKVLSDRDFYKRKKTMVAVLKRHFPDFEIVDQAQ